jgi:hypothetical protein
MSANVVLSRREGWRSPRLAANFGRSTGRRGGDLKKQKAVLIHAAPLANSAALAFSLGEARKYFAEFNLPQPPLPDNVLSLAPRGLLISEWEEEQGEKIGRIQISATDDSVMFDEEWPLSLS